MCNKHIFNSEGFEVYDDSWVVDQRVVNVETGSIVTFPVTVKI